MDSLTLDALRAAFLVSLERYKSEVDAGRSHNFASIAATSFVVPRIEATLQGHEERRHVRAAPGKDFRYEAMHAADCLIKKLRTGTPEKDALADYWRRLNLAVIHDELI